MMIYIEKNNRNKRKWITYLIIGFIVLIFISLQVLTPNLFPSLFSSFVSPFWRADFAIESGSLKTEKQLINEIEILKRKMMENSIRTSLVENTEIENTKLRYLLGKASSTTSILSAILKKPPFYIYDEFIIDVGHKENIADQALVYADGNIPIGRVVDIFPNTSRVLLFSSPGQKHEVLIGKNNVPALAVGQGGGQFEAELPKGIEINENDFVSLSSVDASPIGKVVAVISNPTLTFQRILFSIPVNLYELRWVLVETKK